MSNWAYAILCIVAPALWSLILHAVFRAVEKRQKRFRRESEAPPVDYSI